MNIEISESSEGYNVVCGGKSSLHTTKAGVIIEVTKLLGSELMQEEVSAVETEVASAVSMVETAVSDAVHAAETSVEGALGMGEDTNG